MEWAALGRTRWASEKASGRSEGRAPQALPTKSSKARRERASAPKARLGTAGNQPQEDLGEGRREKQNIAEREGGWRGGGLQTQPGRRLAQCLQRRSIPGQPVPPRPAPPTPSPARCSPKRRGSAGPGRLPAASSLRAQPHRAGDARFRVSARRAPLRSSRRQHAAPGARSKAEEL